jgi:hypothetical protein
VRLALAVIVSAIAQLIFFFRYASTGDVATGYLGYLYIVLATMGAGWFAVRRAALAGGLSVIVAALLDAAVILAGPAGQGLQGLDLAASVGSFVIAFWPYIALGAMCGALGGALRARLLSRAPRR